MVPTRNVLGFLGYFRVQAGMEGDDGVVVWGADHSHTLGDY